MNNVTKSIHPMYKESVVISIPQNELTRDGIMHFCLIARTHYEKDYNKQPLKVEVMKEDNTTLVIAR